MEINKRKWSNYISKKSNDQNYYIQFKIEDIHKPITCLLGPNGCGKSLSIRLMREELERQDVPYAYYSTSHNDIVQTSIDFDPNDLVCAFHSEGERMMDSFQKWVRTKLVTSLKENETLYIFIDEADSGLSFDRLLQQFEDLTTFIQMLIETEHKNVKVILTSNSFEMCEALQSPLTEYVWLPTKDSIELDNYESLSNLYRDYFNRYYT